MQNTNIILFDGICNLCCGWVQFLIKVDQKQIFKFSTLQSSNGQNLISNYEFDSKNIESVIYIRNNLIFIYSDAVLEILNDLGGIWKLFLIFKLIPRKLRNIIYVKIAQKRYMIFGTRKQCMVPTPNIEKRFIL